MRPVYVIADNLTTPLGWSTPQNLEALKAGHSGIDRHVLPDYLPEPFYASLFSAQQQLELQGYIRGSQYTFFEKLLIHSIQTATEGIIDLSSQDTGLILSTTKGNISLLETATADAALKKRMSLPESGRRVAAALRCKTHPVIVSHACISGLVAIITGMHMIQRGLYRNIVVAGADIITQFVLSGFQSFHAISNEPCRPFDAARKGINLGEACGCIVLSVNKPAEGAAIQVTGGAVSNDANHISGPSRTGAELQQAIASAIAEAGISKETIDFISAHGTATLYNDEMEAKAINLCGLQDVPLNSLKGYYGHTLGAAGVIEVIACVHSLKDNIILPSLGYQQPGTTQHVKVNSILQSGNYNTCLKTASGFGGCNAALIIQRTL